MDALPSVIGRYQVRERLGHGGMGVLYLALDPIIDRLVALKLLRVDDAELRERFQREARLVARLQSPGIVTIYEVGTHDDQPFMAMEYIAGDTLEATIRRRTPLPLPRKLALLIELCDALAVAHRAGIVHRDIKPSNLIVQRDSGMLKVLDFGIARTVDSSLTQVGAILGTPNYISPEQVEGGAVDHRSDIFAVGVSGYELLGYRQAFSGDTPFLVLQQIVRAAPTPLLDLDPTLDPGLQAIIDKAMAKDPGARYPDLETMRADLLHVARRLESQTAQQTLVIAPLPATAMRGAFGTGDGADGAAPTVTPSSVASQPSRASGSSPRSDRIPLQPPAVTPVGSRSGKDLARLLEQRATQMAACLRRADEALERGEPEWALRAAEQAVLIDPHDPRVTATLERAHAAVDRARELTRLVDRAVQHGEACVSRGDMEGARRAASEALGYDPRSEAAQRLREEVDAAVERRTREQAEQDARARTAEETVARQNARRVARGIARVDASLLRGTLDWALVDIDTLSSEEATHPEVVAAAARVEAAIARQVDQVIEELAGGRWSRPPEAMRLLLDRAIERWPALLERRAALDAGIAASAAAAASVETSDNVERSEVASAGAAARAGVNARADAGARTRDAMGSDAAPHARPADAASTGPPALQARADRRLDDSTQDLEEEPRSQGDWVWDDERRAEAGGASTAWWQRRNARIAAAAVGSALILGVGLLQWNESPLGARQERAESASARRARAASGDSAGRSPAGTARSGAVRGGAAAGSTPAAGSPDSAASSTPPATASSAAPSGATSTAPSTATSTEPAVPATGTPAASSTAAPLTDAAAAAEAATNAAVAETIDRVRSLLEARQDTAAIEATQEAVAKFGQDARIQSLLQETVRAADEDAQRARRRAVRVMAPVRATSDFVRAEDASLRAAELRRDGRGLDAARGYWRAARLFAAASDQAALAPPQAGRLPAPAEITAIQDGLNRWASEHSSPDAKKVVDTWPSLAPDERDRLKASVETMAGYTVTFQGCQIVLPDARAAAQCVVRRAMTFKSGGAPQASSARMLFQLERRGDRWVVVTVTAS